MPHGMINPTSWVLNIDEVLSLGGTNPDGPDGPAYPRTMAGSIRSGLASSDAARLGFRVPEIST
jgi:hypothetical protein